MPALKWTEHADLAIRKSCTVGRDEYLDHMTFRANTRPLFTEIFGPLIGLKEEWEAQGASQAELDMSAFRYRCPRTVGLPVATGWVGGPPTVVLEETREHRLLRDSMGRTLKLARGVSTLPLPQDWPVRTMDDWLKVKPHYQFTEGRLAGGWERVARDAAAGDCAVSVGIPGGYDEPRQLMGDEAACVAFVEQPELIHDMLATLAETAVRVLDRVTRMAGVDILSVHEDMAGRSGPMVGPRQVRGLISPYYRRVWDLAAERGARLFEQDSDGNMEAVIEPFLEAGVNLMYPVEPAAGMDLVRLRERYGSRLAFMGGLDKHVLRGTRAEIDAELERKVPAMMATGGCLLGLDHRIPNGTPLANYRYYVDRMWELMGGE